MTDIKELARKIREIGYYKEGGKIHIKDSRKGTFTAAATKHGKSVQAFASQVLANKENYSPAMVKKANFARNAAKWHAEGGQLQLEESDGTHKYRFTNTFPGPPKGLMWPVKVEKIEPEEPKQEENLLAQDVLRLRQRYAESSFDDKAISDAGAKGAFQIMPKTYDEYSKKMGEEGDLLDPEYNGRLRDFIWNDLYNSFTATNQNPPEVVRLAKALAMYNRGRGAVGDWLADQKRTGVDIYNSTDWVDSMPWKETRDYVNFILFGKDIPDSDQKNATAYKAAREKYGYADGGLLKRILSIYGVDKIKAVLASRPG